MSIKDFLPSIRRSDGKIDGVAVFLSLLTFSIFVLALVLYRQEATPTFEFLDDFAPVVNEGPIVPGDDLVIELHFKSQNKPGKTDLFGMFVCEDGYAVTAEQYRPYSIILGGGDPFEATTKWPVPTPEDLPRDASCEYRHAAVLANGSVQTIGATFETSQ